MGVAAPAHSHRSHASAAPVAREGHLEVGLLAFHGGHAPADQLHQQGVVTGVVVATGVVGAGRAAPSTRKRWGVRPGQTAPVHRGDHPAVAHPLQRVAHRHHRHSPRPHPAGEQTVDDPPHR